MWRKWQIINPNTLTYFDQLNVSSFMRYLLFKCLQTSDAQDNLVALWGIQTKKDALFTNISE